MNETALATRPSADIIEAVIAKGDLSKLTPEERTRYYVETCRSLGLNQLTNPFQYITLNGRLTLYATRTTTDQLRKIHSVSIEIVSREAIGDIYMVVAKASTPDGRTDEEIGAVNIGGLKGDALANAYMKAITKAKRRVTLSIVGLGWLDETEVETIPDARRVHVDTQTGEILERVHAAPKPAAPPPMHPLTVDDLPFASDDEDSGEDIAPIGPTTTCRDCKKSIPPAMIGNEQVDAIDVAERTFKKYGRSLCSTCAKKAMVTG